MSFPTRLATASGFVPGLGAVSFVSPTACLAVPMCLQGGFLVVFLAHVKVCEIALLPVVGAKVGFLAVGASVEPLIDVGWLER